MADLSWVDKILSVGLAIWLVAMAVRYAFPSVWEWFKDRTTAQDTRIDKGSDKLVELVEKTATHIAVGNANYEAAAKRDELVIEALVGLRGAFDIFVARFDERDKATKDTRDMIEARFEKMHKLLGDIRQENAKGHALARKVARESKQ